MSERFEATFSVGKFTCDMSLTTDNNRLNVAWSPDVPRRLKLKHLNLYRAKRDEFLAGIAEAKGICIAVMEP